MDRTECRSVGRLRLAALAAIFLCAAGCASPKVMGESSHAVRIGDRFVANTVAGSKRTQEGGSFTPHFRVVRNGHARDALVLEAPVTIRAPLEGLTAGAVLECLATPVFNVGDGMQMEVSLIENGRDRVLLRRYYDAGRRLADRAWTLLRIPLDLQGTAGAAQLEIRVSAGPQGDLVADWLAISDLHIVQGQGQQ